MDRIAADPVTGSFGCLLVYLSGVVTAATQRLLSTALGQVLSQTPRIIVDLSRVVDTDVPGLLTLLEEIHLARRRGCVVVLAAPSAAVQQVLLTGTSVHSNVAVDDRSGVRSGDDRRPDGLRRCTDSAGDAMT